VFGTTHAATSGSRAQLRIVSRAQLRSHGRRPSTWPHRVQASPRLATVYTCFARNTLDRFCPRVEKGSKWRCHSVHDLRLVLSQRRCHSVHDLRLVLSQHLRLHLKGRHG
jgi:hypothetical protein